MRHPMMTLFTALAVLGLLTACSQADDGTLVVATDATFPPFEFVDETTREIIGFDIDLMDAISERANLEINYQNVS